jgi:hypothetical protein
VKSLKWEDLSKEDKGKLVDGFFNSIKERIVSHATGVSVSTDREHPKVKDRFGNVLVIRPEIIRESITIDISYIGESI